MLSKVLVCRVLPVMVALTLSATTFAIAQSTPLGAGAPQRLPDLDQATPAELVITRAGTPSKPVYRLLSVRGQQRRRRSARHHRAPVGRRHRDHGRRPVGRARRCAAGGRSECGRVALRRLSRPSPLAPARLRPLRATPGGHRGAAVRDRKTGFCLGDRYPVTGRGLPGAPPGPVYTSRCGLGDSGLLGIEEVSRWATATTTPPTSRASTCP